MADEFTGEIDWYLPEPRAIIPLDGFHASRSLKKRIRQREFEVCWNRDFEGVMRGCADRPEVSWISEEFIRVYGELHGQGLAHSVETWRDGRLAGGLYGVSIGGAFMAESMFHRETDASKVALAALVDVLRERGFTLLDVQFATPHLIQFGVIEIPHALYACLLRAAIIVSPSPSNEAEHGSFLPAPENRHFHRELDAWPDIRTLKSEDAARAP